jgi:AcrR family transcriptional regulator
MARTTGSDGDRTAAAIREAAARLIARHGYDAVSMRQLASEVGVQAAALYRYFPAKEDLLFALMLEHFDGLTASWERARPRSSDPLERLSAFLRNHIGHAIAHRLGTHICNMELRSLSHERLSAMLKLRGAYEKELRQMLRDGAASRVFCIDDLELTTIAVVQMITGVIVWFRPDDRLTVDQVAERYLAMTLRLLDAPQMVERGHVHEDA